MANPSSSEHFDEDLFEARLEALKDTQEGIQQMSTWCLQQRAHYKKIIQSWLNVFKRVRVDHRLVLFYLANDVIQYSKRKRYEFVECWATALQRATTMVRDERVKGKILRIFNIWEQREIYNEEFLSDLSGLLNIKPPKKSQASADASDDFQSTTLIAHIRECVQLADLTDKSFAKLPKMPNCDIEVIKQQLKDKSHSCDIEKEFERSVAYTDAYKKHLHNEIKARKSVIEDLELAMKFFATQRGEVKVVATAYKNFASRVKMVNKKVEELVDTLASPMPSPDINAPSPERDADLQLPGEHSPISLNIFKSSINGYSSYLDGKLPFDINDFKRESGSSSGSSQPIEVIGSRSDDESYNSGVEYYKADPISSYSNSGAGSIPGLSSVPVSSLQSEYSSLARSAQQYNTLLPPPAPPVYGSGHSHSNEYVPHMPSYSGEAYTPRPTNSAQSGIMPPPPPLPPSIGSQTSSTADDFNSTWDMNMSWTPLDNSNASSSSYTQSTPHSPPHFERKAHNSVSAPIEYSEHHTDLMGTQDVDHRQVQLPPAFAFSAKLGLSADKSRQLVDIDHRNLISLTGSPGGGEKDFHTNTSGDVDYRKPQVLIGDDSAGHNASPSSSQLMAPPNSSYAKKSPQKSNASSSSESAKEDGCPVSRYDPADMVIDMDMSDEDIDEMLKEVNDGQLEDVDVSVMSGNELTLSTDDSTCGTPTSRPALLETPPEYIPQNVWDANNSHMPPPYVPGGVGNSEMDMQQQQQQQQSHPAWNQMSNPVPWNGNGVPPPPPRPPFPMAFQQFQPVAGSPDNMRGRGRGRGWTQNQYRPNFPRTPRGGANGGSFDGPRPYFNRGGGVIRGNRGKFRGNNAWI